MRRKNNRIVEEAEEEEDEEEENKRIVSQNFCSFFLLAQISLFLTIYRADLLLIGVPSFKF